MLVDRELEEPLTMLTTRSWARLSKKPPRPVSPADETQAKSCFSFLSKLKKSSSEGQTQRRVRARPVSAVMSPLPPWVWDLYSPSSLVCQVRQELSKLSSLSPNNPGVPLDPTELSWWVTSNLPLPDSLRTRKFYLTFKQ